MFLIIRSNGDALNLEQAKLLRDKGDDLEVLLSGTEYYIIYNFNLGILAYEASRRDGNVVRVERQWRQTNSSRPGDAW